MKTADRYIHELLDLPHARILLEQVQKQLQEEECRRQAFHHNISENEKAEFINGKIIMHSPVRSKHLRISFYISNLIGNYAQLHQLGEIGVEKMLIALSRNSYEPDICFFRKAQADQFTDDQKIFPAPDLVVEILSDSTEKTDRTIKFQDYQNHNIAEYWIVDADKETIEQYILENEEYKLQRQEEHITSQVIEGFSAPVSSFFDDEKNMKALNEILKDA